MRQNNKILKKPFVWVEQSPLMGQVDCLFIIGLFPRGIMSSGAGGRYPIALCGRQKPQILRPKVQPVRRKKLL